MAELIGKRYGTALFELAKESDQIDKMQLEVKELIKIIEKEPELLEIISHPQVSTEKKEMMIEDIFSSNVSDYIIGLIDVTIKKGRQGQLIGIFNYFLELVDEYNNIIKVDVTTTIPLADDYRKRLIAKLEKITGSSVIINEYIDAAIIGGIIIKIGSRIVDNSIEGQIKRLSKELLINT